MVGNMVLRKTDLKKGNAGLGKFMSNWEGPFRVTKLVRPRAYKIAYLNEKALPKLWNIVNFRKFYQ